MHEHQEPGAFADFLIVAGLRPFEHLLIAGRVAKSGHGTTADEQVDAFRLAGMVVDQKTLRAIS